MSRGARRLPLRHTRRLPDTPSTTFAVGRHAVRAFWLGLSVVLTASVSNATAVFMGLGTLPGSASSAAYAVSADGSAVVGYSDDEAFRWTAKPSLRMRRSYARWVAVRDVG
jgi:uncharacterized membrane protein